jgi:hypothetical protein
MGKQKTIKHGTLAFRIETSEMEGKWYGLVVPMPSADGRAHNNLPQWKCDAPSESELEEKIVKYIEDSRKRLEADK